MSSPSISTTKTSSASTNHSQKELVQSHKRIAPPGAIHLQTTTASAISHPFSASIVSHPGAPSSPLIKVIDCVKIAVACLVQVKLSGNSRNDNLQVIVTALQKTISCLKSAEQELAKSMIGTVPKASIQADKQSTANSQSVTEQDQKSFAAELSKAEKTVTLLQAQMNQIRNDLQALKKPLKKNVNDNALIAKKREYYDNLQKKLAATISIRDALNPTTIATPSHDASHAIKTCIETAGVIETFAGNLIKKNAISASDIETLTRAKEDWSEKLKTNQQELERKFSEKVQLRVMEVPRFAIHLNKCANAIIEIVDLMHNLVRQNLNEATISQAAEPVPATPIIGPVTVGNIPPALFTI